MENQMRLVKAHHVLSVIEYSECESCESCESCHTTYLYIDSICEYHHVS